MLKRYNVQSVLDLHSSRLKLIKQTNKQTKNCINISSLINSFVLVCKVIKSGNTLSQVWDFKMRTRWEFNTVCFFKSSATKYINSLIHSKTLHKNTQLKTRHIILNNWLAHPLKGWRQGDVFDFNFKSI